MYLCLGQLTVSRPNNKGSHFCKSMCVISCGLSLGALEALIKKGKGLVPFPFITGDRAKAWKEGSPARRPHWAWHAAQNLEKVATA